MLRALAGLVLLLAIVATGWSLFAANETPNATTPGAAPTGQAPAPSAGKADAGGSPLDTAKSAAKGSLKSPYPDFAKVADEGHQKFTAAGCNGCHGGTGGGGMGPPLTNQVWSMARTTTRCSAWSRSEVTSCRSKAIAA
jgi:hypothetical protein